MFAADDPCITLVLCCPSL